MAFRVSSFILYPQACFLQLEGADWSLSFSALRLHWSPPCLLMTVFVSRVEVGAERKGEGDRKAFCGAPGVGWRSGCGRQACTAILVPMGRFPFCWGSSPPFSGC